MNIPSASGIERYQQALADVVRQLQRDGWSVEVEPSGERYGLGNYRPDYVATQGGQLIVGEVKSRGSFDLNELSEVVGKVEQIANARLDLTWLGAVEPPTPPEETSHFTGRARHLVLVDVGAALLLAWGALSAALEKIAEDDSLSPRSPRQRLTEMASLGTLSEQQYYRLEEISHTRNDIAHGRPPESDPEPWMVEYVCTTAEALASGEYYSVDAMIEWFQERYKDPADGVPHDSGEGGYIYVNGGPFDADEVLQEQYPLMPLEDVEDAVSILQNDSYEWVRVEDY